MDEDVREVKRGARARVSAMVVVYLLLCAAWIAWSTGALKAFADDYPMLYWIIANDRWAFAAVSAIALYAFGTRVQIRSAVAQHERVESERALSNLMNHLPGMAYRRENDIAFTVRYASGGCRELTGYDPADLEGNRRADLRRLVHPDDIAHVTEALEQALARGHRYRLEYRVVSRDGTTRWVMDSGSGVEEVDGRYTLLEGLMVDITQQKQAQQQLTEQQEHLEEIVAARTAELTAEIEQRRELEMQLRELTTRDALTGLFNRREMERFLAAEVDRCARYKRKLSVVMIDIDHFKRLNDTYGHQAGDEVLRWVAGNLRAGVRTTDRAVRYGGEEMALILPETDSPDAMTVADRLREVTATTGIDIVDEKGVARHVEVTFSAGVSCFPGDGQTGDALIAAADQALYASKRGGRNRVTRAKQSSGPPKPHLFVAAPR